MQKFHAAASSWSQPVRRAVKNALRRKQNGNEGRTCWRDLCASQLRISCQTFRVSYTRLIFGLPALRNVQPGVPSVGAFSDYVIFIGAELIVAVSAVVTVWHWLLRPRSGAES